MSTAHREFWTQGDDGNDFCVAITHWPEEAEAVWAAMCRARTFVVERQHEEHRYKGRFLRGWSKADGYFYSESPEADLVPGGAAPEEDV